MRLGHSNRVTPSCGPQLPAPGCTAVLAIHAGRCQAFVKNGGFSPGGQSCAHPRFQGLVTSQSAAQTVALGAVAWGDGRTPPTLVHANMYTHVHAQVHMQSHIHAHMHTHTYTRLHAGTPMQPLGMVMKDGGVPVGCERKRQLGVLASLPSSEFPERLAWRTCTGETRKCCSRLSSSFPTTPSFLGGNRGPAVGLNVAEWGTAGSKN